MDGAGEGLLLVIGVTGLKAVIELTQASVEDGAQCRNVPVAACSVSTVLVLDRPDLGMAAKAQANPTAASLLFFTCR